MNLDTQLEKILELTEGDVYDKDKKTQERIAQLKSLIKSTLLDALPKEKEITITERNARTRKWDRVSDSTFWATQGYSQALKDIKDTLK